jgi:hypothetical protein
VTISVTSSNGEAPASALSTLPGHNGDGAPHTAPHVTAQSYARIRAGMQGAGLGDLLPSDGWSCYRTLADQQHMRDLELTTAAVGTSIHGEWSVGSAVDFTGLGGFGAPRHEWLRHNGGGHGWYQPGWAQAGGSLPEPWHWEYDSRNDQHAGEEPEEEEDMTPEQANTLDHIAALLEQTPYRSAQQVHYWQVSRHEGAPTTFLQDQTDGVSNTYALVADANATGQSAWTPGRVLQVLLAVAVVVLIILAPFVLTLDDAALGYVGILGALASAVATLVVVNAKTAHRVIPPPPHIPTQPPAVEEGEPDL